jgi:branched-chain amino acid aminotransferase
MMMDYNLNGFIIRNKHLGIQVNNRGLNYGDGIFETIKFANNRLNFWEDHYFRLMASMRIVRMDIPMTFSPEYLEEEIRKTLAANHLSDKSARIKLLVVRKAGGLYTPESNDIDFLITTEELLDSTYQLNEEGLNIELYKDFYKNSGMLGNIKSTSAQLYTVASIFRKENDFDECLLINERKEVVEAISANIFILKGDDLITPPLDSGCLKGIMRKKVIEFAPQIGLTIKEEAFSPFALQKADEVWLTNSIKGLQWVGQYRKKSYGHEKATEMLKKININLALSLT